MLEENILKQSQDILSAAKKVLLILPVHPTRDAAASCFALNHALTKLGLESQIVCAGQVPLSLSFFDESTRLLSKIEGSTGLVVTVDSANAKLESLRYDVIDGEVKIYLTAANGSFNTEGVKAEKVLQKFDVVVTFGAASLDDLNSVYQQNTDLFFSSPLINIDTSAHNERYGSVNLVSLTYTSIAEIVKVLIEKLGSNLIDEEIATRLLAGIVARTQSFQDVRTTPSAFIAAAELMEKSGRHQEVIQHLFKTKPLPLLQLWGRTLARLKVNGDPSFLCSNVTLADLEKTGFEKSGLHLRLVLEELLENVSGFKVICLLVERAGSTLALLAFNPNLGITGFLEKVGKSGVSVEHFGFYSMLELEFMGEDITQTETKIAEAVKQIL